MLSHLDENTPLQHHMESTAQHPLFFLRSVAHGVQRLPHVLIACTFILFLLLAPLPVPISPPASRMESNGFPMCIHVSSATQKLLHAVADWHYFGCREIKG